MIFILFFKNHIVVVKINEFLSFISFFLLSGTIKVRDRT